MKKKTKGSREEKIKTQQGGYLNHQTDRQTDNPSNAHFVSLPLCAAYTPTTLSLPLTQEQIPPSVLPNPRTRRILPLPNPCPHRLTNTDPQPRHRPDEKQRNEHVHRDPLLFGQIGEAPTALVAGFGFAEEGGFVGVVWVGRKGLGRSNGVGVDGDAFF